MYLGLFPVVIPSLVFVQFHSRSIGVLCIGNCTAMDETSARTDEGIDYLYSIHLHLPISLSDGHFRS